MSRITLTVDMDYYYVLNALQFAEREARRQGLLFTKHCEEMILKVQNMRDLALQLHDRGKMPAMMINLG